jgi:hypothetical protein
LVSTGTTYSVLPQRGVNLCVRCSAPDMLNDSCSCCKHFSCVLFISMNVVLHGYRVIASCIHCRCQHSSSLNGFVNSLQF